MYDNNIAFLKKYMQMDEIPSYYYKWGTNVAAELANYRDKMVNHKKTTEFDFPYMQFNDSDVVNVARGYINRASDTQIYTGIKYNSKTGKFSATDTAEPTDIRKELDECKPGDVQMWLAPTPLNDNYFHIAMKIFDGSEYHTYMIPLKAATHFSDAKITENLYGAYTANRDVIASLSAKYPKHKITDAKDLKAFKEANLFMKEFYKLHIINTIKASHQDIKDYQQDMNAGPEWTDIDGKKLTTNKKTGSTEYAK